MASVCIELYKQVRGIYTFYFTRHKLILEEYNRQTLFRQMLAILAFALSSYHVTYQAPGLIYTPWHRDVSRRGEILNSRSIWRWVVSFTRRLLYPQGKSLRYKAERAPEMVWRLWRRGNCLLAKNRSPGRTDHSLVTILAEPPRLINKSDIQKTNPNSNLSIHNTVHTSIFTTNSGMYWICTVVQDCQRVNSKEPDHAHVYHAGGIWIVVN